MTERKRENVFTKHPEGATILQKILSGDMTITKAAEKLGCSKANISQYLKKHNLKVQDKNIGPTVIQPTTPLPLTNGMLSEFENLLNADEDTNALGPKMWIIIERILLKSLSRGGETAEIIKIISELRKLLEFRFKNTIPDPEEKELVLNSIQEDYLISKMEDICAVCPYRISFDERKAVEQEKERLVS